MKFAKGIRNQTVADGGEAKFQVELSSDRVCDVRWQRNGVTIKSDDVKYSIESEGGKHALTIHDVSANDGVVYSCVVGSAKTSARLYVDGKFRSSTLRKISTFPVQSGLSRNLAQGKFGKNASELVKS